MTPQYLKSVKRRMRNERIFLEKLENTLDGYIDNNTPITYAEYAMIVNNLEAISGVVNNIALELTEEYRR